MDRIRHLSDIPSMPRYPVGKVNVAELEAAVHVAPRRKGSGADSGSSNNVNKGLSAESVSSGSLADNTSQSDASMSGKFGHARSTRLSFVRFCIACVNWDCQSSSATPPSRAKRSTGPVVALEPPHVPNQDLQKRHASTLADTAAASLCHLCFFFFAGGRSNTFGHARVGNTHP